MNYENNNREIKTMVKLNSVVTEYLRLEEEKRQYALEKAKSDTLDKTAVETLYLMQERLNTLTKQIVLLVDRCIDNDYDMDNECATVIYNYYKPLIRRGLFNLY